MILDSGGGGGVEGLAADGGTTQDSIISLMEVGQFGERK
jgi:hypothetical protein